MTITQLRPKTEPLAAIAGDLAELEGAATEAYRQGCGSTTFLHDMQDVLVVSEADFPTAYNYVIEYYALLAGQPVRLNFACGPAWAIPFDADKYHQDLDDLQYECVGWKVTQSATFGKDSPLDSGGHPACPNCKSTMFKPSCPVCSYVSAGTSGAV